MNAGEITSGETSHEDVPREESRAAVFVSDPSAEAERVAQQLRAAGYVVVDVPLSMLAARVAVQTPCAIIVDADAVDVDQALAAVRRAGGRAHLDLVLLGQKAADGTVKIGDEASRQRSEEGGRHFFARPVDPAQIVREIDALTGGPDSGAPEQPARSNPPYSRDPPTTTAQAWPQVIPDHRAPAPSAPPSSPQSVRPAPSSSPHHDPPMSARSVRPVVSIRTALSAELEALLLEAEQRVGLQLSNELAPPTPEEEIESVLPEALLAALDEPIDEDDDDVPGELPRSRVVPELSRASQDPASAETNAGRALTPRPSHTPPATVALGVARTMHAPPLRADEAEHEIEDAEIAPLPLVQIERPAPEPEARLGSPTSLLGPEGAARMLAFAIASRKSGCLTIEADSGLRRVVLRDGDLVMAASSADDETLLEFLTARGDLRRDQVKELVGKVPPFGRHAGAALVGHGILRQDQLWPILRAHAEWTVGRLLLVPRGTSRFDGEAPGRLKLEPSVFGGSSGAEVLVEVTRRVVAPEEALKRLGGGSAVISEGPGTLLSECALEGHDRAVVEQGRGLSLDELTLAGSDMASVLYALSLLGIVTVTAAPAVDFAARAGRPSDDASPEASRREANERSIDALDLAAVREQVRARSDLVAEADYFTLLGVPREATGYEVRRAYLELRRSFEPTHILTPELSDLEADVRTIVEVLDEAYEILRDGVRRERYRRALGS